MILGLGGDCDTASCVMNVISVRAMIVAFIMFIVIPTLSAGIWLRNSVVHNTNSIKNDFQEKPKNLRYYLHAFSLQEPLVVILKKEAVQITRVFMEWALRRVVSVERAVKVYSG